MAVFVLYSIGQTTIKIILRSILPNVAASIIVPATLQVATVMVVEAALGILGRGIQLPTLPGIAITLSVSGIMLWGECLRDGLDSWLKT